MTTAYTNIKTALQDHGRNGLRGFAMVLSIIVYTAALVYAGVRSYDLFARTLPPDLLGLALLGIVALEVTALGLPLAVHFWTAPGQQRMIAYGFYFLDLVLIIANSILDAAYNSGAILPGFMQWYGVFAVPGLPVFCMVGWALIWMTDPTTREHDMKAAVSAATREALFGRIIEETAQADITAEVQAAARLQVREIVGETLGIVRAIGPGATAPMSTTTGGRAAESTQPESRPATIGAPVYLNGTETRAKAEATEAPKG